MWSFAALYDLATRIDGWAKSKCFAEYGKSYKSGMFVGFLPMFGPCYVNFYGSPREYSELMTEFEELNFGKVSIES